MNLDHNHREFSIIEIVNQYTVMSQEGTVGIFEETVFEDIINYFIEHHETEWAHRAIRDASNFYPYSAVFYAIRAKVFQNAGHISGAKRWIDRAIALDPSNVEYLVLQAEFHFEENDPSIALQLLDNLLLVFSGKDQAEIIYSKACIYKHLNHYDLLFDCLRELLIICPDHPNALQMIWFATEATNRFVESIEVYLRQIDHNPYCHISWFNLGHSYRQVKNYPLAAEAFEYAFITNPSFESAYRECAKVNITMGAVEVAQEILEESMDKFAPETETCVLLGTCFEIKKDFRNAMICHEEALRLNRRNEDAWFRIGECYRSQSKWDEAIKAYNRAFQINPLAEEYLAASAECYFEKNDSHKAMTLLDQLIETAPEITKYWLQNVKYLLKTNQHEEAMLKLESADINNGAPEIRYGKIACLLASGRRMEALELLNDALEEHFDFHKTIFELAPQLESDHELMTTITSFDNLYNQRGNSRE